MAKGDVILKFDAETATFVQNVIKARQAADEMADSSRKLGESMAKAGSHAGVMGNAMDALSEKAKNFIMAGVTEYLDKAQHRADELVLKVRGLNAALAGGGSGGLSGQTRSEIAATVEQGIGGRPVNPKEMYDAVVQIQNEVRGKDVTHADVMHAATVSVNVQRTGLDAAQGREVGGIRARLSTYQDISKGFEGTLGTDAQKKQLAAEKLDSLALQAFQHGGLDDKEMEMVAEAPDKTGMLNYIFASHAAGLRSKGLRPVEEVIAQPELSQRERQQLQHEERSARHAAARKEAGRRLAVDALGQDPQARRAAILAEGGEKFLPENEQPYIRALRIEARKLQTAGTKGTDQQIVEYERGLDAGGRAVEEDRDAEANMEQERQLDEVYDARVNTKSKRLQAEARRHYPIFNKVLPDAFFKYPADITSIQTTGKDGPKSDPHLDILEGIHETLQMQNSLIRTRRDTALRNDSPGQQ